MRGKVLISPMNKNFAFPKTSISPYVSQGQTHVFGFLKFAFPMQNKTFPQHGSELKMTRKYMHVENCRSHLKIQFFLV